MANKNNTTDLQLKFKNYLKDLFVEVAKSEQSPHAYFAPDAQNKENFVTKTDSITQKYFDSIDDLFDAKDARADKSKLFTNAIFHRATKDMYDGNFHLYMPKKSGDDFVFSKQQEEVFGHLASSILGTLAAQEELKDPISETIENLKKSGFTNTENLKYNEETGLIEGKVTNKNEEEVEIAVDPSMPEFMFINGNIVMNDTQDLIPMAGMPAQPQEGMLSSGAQTPTSIPTDSQEPQEEQESPDPLASLGLDIEEPESENSKPGAVPFKQQSQKANLEIEAESELELNIPKEQRANLQIKIPGKGNLPAGMQAGRDPGQKVTEELQTRSETQVKTRVTEDDLIKEKHRSTQLAQQQQQQKQRDQQLNQERIARKTEEEQQGQQKQKKKTSPLKKVAMSIAIGSGAIPAFSIGGVSIWQALQG
jgi:hypothetical protein